jgi:hypothetical protein
MENRAGDANWGAPGRPSRKAPNQPSTEEKPAYIGRNRHEWVSCSWPAERWLREGANGSFEGKPERTVRPGVRKEGAPGRFIQARGRGHVLWAPGSAPSPCAPMGIGADGRSRCRPALGSRRRRGRERRTARLRMLPAQLDHARGYRRGPDSAESAARWRWDPG